jgi:hypothetical protein
MKKLIGLLAGLVLISGTMVMAETKFTPLNFDESNTIKSESAKTVTKATVDNKGNVMLDPSQVTGGTKMQNAILDLDNAQTEVRNKLLNYRSNYSNIDQKYQVTKEERRAAKKRIKQAEKQIRNMENAKKKIRKNFEQKNNL